MSYTQTQHPLFKPAFDVVIKVKQVKLGPGQYRSAGYKRLNVEPMTYESALGFGMKETDLTARASFFVKPAGGSARPSRKYEEEYLKLKGRFRQPFYEKKQGGMLKLVEKTAFRISSKGEKVEIPYEAQRLRRTGAIKTGRRR